MTTPPEPVTIGFILNDPGGAWTGGGNYLSNLLFALRTLPDRKFRTVLVAAPDISAAALARFPTDRVIRSRIFQPRSPERICGKISERLLSRNLPIERFCRRSGIDVLSHTMPFGRRSRVPTIAWIPDFQERHLPGFFSRQELARRAVGQRRVVAEAAVILLSSKDARKDLTTLYPEASRRARVLHFVAGFHEPVPVPDRSEVRDHYGLPDRYFHLPNQLWAHKNHAVVIDALAILKARGSDACVICTGHLEDYRDPDFQRRIRDRAAAAGIGNMLRIAGLVPYGHVRALFANSVAVINPSLFEGWSTTVEEAKSLGKRVLLSDIPVHREQDPERGSFFAPDDATALADLMGAVLASWDETVEAREATLAADRLPARTTQFARDYERIAIGAAGG